jgi:hypothetical protein
MIRHFSLTITLLLFCILNIHAQNQFTGIVMDTTSHVVRSAQVILSKEADIVSVLSTDSTGVFNLKGLKLGGYNIRISSIGFKTYEGKIAITATEGLKIFTLKPDLVQLNEVTVTARRLPKTTATGQIYYLSEKARKSNSPFTALKEIPGLVSNDVTNSLKTADGTKLLILIDGNRVNSGIDPISPSRIESVEVQDVIDAKFMAMGIGKIVNIHLKEVEGTYQFFELYTKHDMPIYNGNSSAQYEGGNTKLSIFGKVNYDYQRNHKRTDENDFKGTDFQRIETAESKQRGDKVDYTMMMKYNPNKNDHLALYFYGINDRNRTNANGQGYMNTSGVNSNFVDSRINHQSATLFSPTFYYKHIFSKKANLENNITYSYNSNNTRNNAKQSYDKYDWDGSYRLKTKRNVVSWTSDYATTLGKSLNFSTGNALSYSNETIDNIGNTTNTQFRHKLFEEYAYVGVGKTGFFSYMTSLGVDAFKNTSAGISKWYVRPRIAASASLNFRQYGSLKLSYNLDNKKPYIMELNPYTTSSDSLRRYYGNPKLKPEMNHSWMLNYSLREGDFYFTPQLKYAITKDLIEMQGFKDSKGIFNQTYANTGHYDNLETGLSTIFMKSSTMILAYVARKWDYFAEQSVKKSVEVLINASCDIGRFNIQGTMLYMDNLYSPISTTHFSKPMTSDFMLTYRASQNLQLTAGMENFVGKQHTNFTTAIPEFNSFTKQTISEFRPFIAIRWTLRKNDSKKVDLDKNIIRRQENIITVKDGQ